MTAGDIETITNNGSNGTIAENQGPVKYDATELGKTLIDPSKRLSERFRSIFRLRNINSPEAIEALAQGLLFADGALLKHEIAYCMGQTQNPAAIPALIKTLEDKSQDPMVRHEAGEALGAIGDSKVIDLLKLYSKDECVEVAETCELALKRLEWLQNNKNEHDSVYDSVDPTPASNEANVEQLGKALVDVKKSLWERYRAMFALRNINSPESIKALAQGLFCEDSALFRHEIAYVLGQIQSPIAIPELKSRLCMAEESGMVRHECAEALGAIGTEECDQLLKEYAKDKERVVRESCEIGLDIAEYGKSKEI